VVNSTEEYWWRASMNEYTGEKFVSEGMSDFYSAGYVDWLEEQIEDLQEQLDNMVLECRCKNRHKWDITLSKWDVDLCNCPKCDEPTLIIGKKQ
jgi:hypothetical protein